MAGVERGQRDGFRLGTIEKVGSTLTRDILVVHIHSGGYCKGLLLHVVEINACKAPVVNLISAALTHLLEKERPKRSERRWNKGTF